jgi:hypothetical protein
MTHLELADISTVEQVRALPQSLRKLSLFVMAPCWENPNFWAALPRGLENLHLSIMDQDQLKLSGKLEFPPALKVFDVHSAEFQNPEALYSLPQTLLRLRCRTVAYPITGQPWRSWPSLIALYVLSFLEDYWSSFRRAAPFLMEFVCVSAEAYDSYPPVASIFDQGPVFDFSKDVLEEHYYGTQFNRSEALETEKNSIHPYLHRVSFDRDWSL